MNEVIVFGPVVANNNGRIQNKLQGNIFNNRLFFQVLFLRNYTEGCFLFTKNNYVTSSIIGASHKTGPKKKGCCFFSVV